MSSRLVPSLFILFSTLLSACSPDTPDGAESSAPQLERRAQALNGPDLVELRRQARVASLGDVCPPSRHDTLCGALHAAEQASDPATAADRYADAGRVVADLIAGDAHAAALRDPAVQLYIRDRAHALLVHEALAPDADRVPPDWDDRVDGFLARYFPLYPTESFSMAHAFRPAAMATPEACSAPLAAVVIFPGVLRSAERKEFAAQTSRILRSFPCLEIALVDTNDFCPLDENARAGQAAVAALDARVGALPLHVIGYSQGATNALMMLATDPALRARTRSFYALNSAAHGSEIIDVALADDPRTSPKPVVELLDDTRATLGLSQEDLDPSTAREFFAHVRGGLESLSTQGTAAFWARHGAALPTDILFTSFRSVITDEHANLPPSSVGTYALVAASAPESPFNDMQVRLARQALGGPMADVEVLSHVAEGNHWQWALGPNDLNELLIPHDMLRHVPRPALWLAHVQTLHELGLLFPRQ